jgi:acyl-CoA synthetase (NDP forming)
MAGDYQLMRAKVVRTGVIFANTLQELGDCAEILLRCAPLTHNAVAVLGESGAFKALTLDLTEALGLPLTALHDADSPALRAALPPFVPVSNPLDITAQGLSQPIIYTQTLGALLDDARVGAVMAGIIQSDPITAKIKVPAIIAALEGRVVTKPLVFAGLDEGADMPAHYIAELRARNIPWFPTTERALRALAALGRRADTDLTDATPSPHALPELGHMQGIIPEYRCKELLRPLGISFLEGRFAADVDSAVAAAECVGFPVAMKAQAAALGHKSDAGGVLLNLADAAAVRSAFAQLYANVAAYDRTIKLDCVLIEKMGARGVEMIVGARNDPEWGPVVLAGFGGVTAEILADVRLITPDLSEAAIIAELMQLKQAALLSGYRGAPALDVAALAKLIRMLCAVLIAEPTIVELDLNPVILYPQGQGAIALDALMVVR